MSFLNNEKDFLKHDIRSMNPMKIIKDSAEQLGIVLQKPKPNCKKCHGRGWIGRKADTGEPIACSCIIPKMDEKEIGEVEYKPRNRAERRKMK